MGYDAQKKHNKVLLKRKFLEMTKWLRRKIQMKHLI